MKKWILNMNLHKKFYTLICLLILIPVLVSGIATDAVFLTRFQQQERDVMLNILLQTHNNIRYILDEIDNISLAMLYDESIQSLYRALVLQKGTGSVEVLRRNVLKSLSPMVFNQSYIDAVLVTSGNNKLFEFGETVTREDEELYRQAEAALGRPIWTQARRLNDTVRVNKQYGRGWHNTRNRDATLSGLQHSQGRVAQSSGGRGYSGSGGGKQRRHRGE